jgi:hypothetical protein
VEADAVTVIRSDAAGALVRGATVAGVVDAAVERAGRVVGVTIVVDEDGDVPACRAVVPAGAAVVAGSPVPPIESAALPPPGWAATSATAPAARAAAVAASHASRRRWPCRRPPSRPGSTPADSDV